LCCFLPPHFVGCWNYFVIPLSQPPKRQLPRTLYAMLSGMTGYIGNTMYLTLYFKGVKIHTQI